MNMLDWLHAMNELFKCILVSVGILGYSVNQKCRIRNVLFLLVVSLGVFWWVEPDRTIYALLVTFLFFTLFYEGNQKDKIKAVLIVEVMVGVVELFIWSLLLTAFPQIENIGITLWNFILDLFWAGAVFLLYRYRKITHDYFVNLSFGWIGVLFGLILGMGLMGGSIQYVMDKTVSDVAKKNLLLVQSLVTILVAIGCVALSYNLISKRNMKLLLEKEKEKYLLERKYYSGKLKQNEEIQRFRHDMKKHMKIMYQLCNDISQGKARVERLQEYIDNYMDTYPDKRVVETGHIVADYFLSELISKLSTNATFEYDIMGRFPENLLISDSDLSILLGNALDNATEELEQVKGPCYFCFTIKNNGDNIMIKIENTRAQNCANKPKPNGHGYGIQNMKRIVDRYEGNLDITETDDIFCVEMFL